MTTKALFVRLEAKPGKENEVAKFLRDGRWQVAAGAVRKIAFHEIGSSRRNAGPASTLKPS